MFKFKVPLADKNQYDDMINSGFKKYPKRYENYQKYLQNPKSIIPNFMPIKADIENISRCNFKCPHCIAHLYKGGRAKNLTLDEFKNFIDYQYGLIEIKLQGVGEPFLDKNFTDMVKYASDKFIWVRSTSNGSLLHIDDNYKKVIDANIGELQISVDGADKETFEKVRLGSNFDIVTKNCLLLNNYANRVSNQVKTRMWSVLQKSNFHQAKELIKLAKDLEFKRITLSVELRGWEGHDEVTNFTDTQRVGAINQQWFDDLDEYANYLGIELSFWYATQRFDKKNPCFWMFERFLLSSDGFIVPCCTICDPNVKNFGHIGDFEKIWFKDESVINFRKNHLYGNIPNICKNCYEG